jgi:hypothetical protein
MNQCQEWQEIYAAQEPSYEYSPNTKEGTESQLEITCGMYLSRVY